MKTFAAIFVASLCLFAHATSVYQSPAFLELKKQPFGMTLTTLVQMNMQTNGSGRLDEINKVLDVVATSLTSQTDSNEQTISTQRGWCADQVQSITGNLENAQSDLKKYQDEDANLAEESVSESTNLAREQKDLATNTENKAASETSLNEENARNEQAVKEYAEAIAACNQSITLLKSLYSSPSSFVQTRAKLGNVVALLQKHLANKSSPLIAPVINILTQLATTTQEVDQEKLSKITQLITKLLNELSSQEASNVVRHNTTVEELNSQIASLTDLISQNESAIERHTNRLSEIADRQSHLVSIIGDLNALIPVIEAQLASTHETCSGYEVHYTNVKTQLDQQTATLEKVREYFHQHIATSVEHIRDDVYDDSLSN